MPPIAKKLSELKKYRMPIFLWSVVVSQSRTRFRNGSGRASVGALTTAISAPSLSRARRLDDEHTGHGRTVHVALEVVLPGFQLGDLLRKVRRVCRNPRELRDREVLVRGIEAVPDREVVVD